MATMESRLAAKLHNPLRLDCPTPMRQNPDMSPSLTSVHSNSSNSHVNTPSSSIPQTPVTVTRPPSPVKRPPEPTDTSSFLTALAAQERRVLELKEELQNAELDLDKLKKQWAAYEAVKKRNELRQLEQLQIMKAPVPLPLNVEESPRAVKDLDQRKRAGSSNLRSSQRKVFSGSRHTRTLSLLSPKDNPINPQTGTGIGAESSVRRPPARFRPPPSVSEKSRPQSISQEPSDSNHSTEKDFILETGKQIVGDFRHGLWTFFEDLRQVTVGEEASTAADRYGPYDSRHNGRRSTPGKTEAHKVHELAASDDRSDTVQDRSQQQRNNTGNQSKHTPTQEATANKSQVSNNRTAVVSRIDPDSSDSDDAWDDWDSPDANPRIHRDGDGKASEPMVSPLTDCSSSRTSTRQLLSSIDAATCQQKLPISVDKYDTIWPSLSTFSPGRLTRSASTLMDEWEKSLHPPDDKDSVTGA